MALRDTNLDVFWIKNYILFKFFIYVCVHVFWGLNARQILFSSTIHNYVPLVLSNNITDETMGITEVGTILPRIDN